MTIRIAISGSRTVTTPHQRALIRTCILAIPTMSRIVTGGCLGVDALAARVAFEAGCYVIMTILPSNHRAVDPLWKSHCHGYIQMPPGTTYRDRNIAVLRRADQLLAFPRYPEDDPRSRGSGTWMTIRLAWADDMPVEIHVLDVNGR